MFIFIKIRAQKKLEFFRGDGKLGLGEWGGVTG